MSKTKPKINFTPIIKTTTDYHRFKFIDGNRSVNQAHYNRLKESMIQNPLFCLIIVNENFEIIDGQHRFMALKELGMPINYIVLYGYNVNEVRIYNVNRDNWKKKNFLDSHINEGLEAYVKFKKFMDDFPKLNFSTCIKLLSGLRQTKQQSVDGVRNIIRNFELGTFEIADLKKSYDMAKKIMDYEKYFPKFNDNTFIITLMNLFDNKKFKHDEMISKLKTQPSALIKCATQEQYILLMEKIYNYRRSGKVSFRY